MECGQVTLDSGMMACWCTASYEILLVLPPSPLPPPHAHTHTHTDPCQVELCVVMRYPTDVPEDSCFPFCTALQKSLNGSKTEPVGRVKNIYQGSHVHTASNPIHSTPEDSFDHERSVLAISDVVRVNLHPQLSSSKSFNVFS